MPALAGEPGFERLAEHFPRPLDDESFSGRAMLLKEPFQLGPLVGNLAVSSFGQQIAREFGFHSIIFPPMIRGDKVIGAIGTAHRLTKRARRNANFTTSSSDFVRLRFANAIIYSDARLSR